MAELAEIATPSGRARIPSRYRWIVAAVVLVSVLAMAPWITFRLQTWTDVGPASGSFDHADAALVLGAKVYPNGTPSPFLRERVEVGVHLYQQGYVDRLIMSGDGHGSSGYSEPAVMRALAEEMGVPASAIVEDPLGLETYASCVRARDTFGAKSVIVATQEFHSARAVWLCDRVGLVTQGAFPPPTRTKHTVFGNLREVPAAAKALLDVARGSQPQG